MKTVLIKFMSTMWLMLLVVITALAQTQTQTLPIGTLSNGKAVITQQANAERLLKANLPENVTLSDIKLEYSEYDKGYYITARVGNSDITSVGILLNTNGSGIEALAGPGVEITCHGYKCGDCRITFSKSRPKCKCFDSTQSTDTRCDMTSTITIGF
jgi:hypothetical protein